MNEVEVSHFMPNFNQLFLFGKYFSFLPRSTNYAPRNRLRLKNYKKNLINFGELYTK